MSKKEWIHWSEIDHLLNRLSYQIMNSDRTFKQVVGIAHGGLAISKKIASTLGLPHKRVLISHWSDDTFHPDPIIRGMDFSIKDGKFDPFIENSLIVDDLADSGSTFRLFREMSGKNSYAALYWKPGTSPIDFYAEEKPDTWLVFPWEDDYSNR